MTDSTQSYPVLVGQGGDLNGYRWTINSDITFGRTGSCEIVISNQQVSRKHARVIILPEGPAIEDLNSKNGTRMQQFLLLQVILRPQSYHISDESALKRTRTEPGF